jgi:dTDP-4-amino-4,6-dideoxygalactose transaminase
MTEMQAVLGRMQLRRLAQSLEARRRNAHVLRQRLSGVPGLRIPQPPPHIGHAYYRFYAFIVPAALRAGWTRDRIVAAISELGVPCFSGSCSEIYLEKAFERAGQRPPQRLPIAQELGETSMALLVHPTLTADHMNEAADKVEKVLRQALH